MKLQLSRPLVQVRGDRTSWTELLQKELVVLEKRSQKNLLQIVLGASSLPFWDVAGQNMVHQGLH